MIKNNLPKLLSSDEFIVLSKDEQKNYLKDNKDRIQIRKNYLIKKYKELCKQLDKKPKDNLDKITFKDFNKLENVIKEYKRLIQQQLNQQRINDILPLSKEHFNTVKII